MKSKILFICCFILLLCGCSKKEDTKTEELLTNNDIVLQLSLKMVVELQRILR